MFAVPRTPSPPTYSPTQIPANTKRFPLYFQKADPYIDAPIRQLDDLQAALQYCRNIARVLLAQITKYKKIHHITEAAVEKMDTYVTSMRQFRGRKWAREGRVAEAELKRLNTEEEELDIYLTYLRKIYKETVMFRIRKLIDAIAKRAK